MTDASWPICLGLGLLIGGAMGLTGAGGGVMAVPALVSGMDWSMQQAAPVALLAVASAAAVGALQGLRHKLVRYRAALLMAVVSLPFSWLGVMLAHELSQAMLSSLFAVIVVLTALRVLRLPATNTASEAQLPLDVVQARPCSINPQTGRFSWNWPTAWRLGAMGAAAGGVSGLLGVSGGFLIVPLLRSFTPLSMQSVVATSLFVTALISLGSVFNAFAHGAQIPFAVTLLFAFATVSGLMLARHIGRGMPQVYVQRTFAALLMLVALKLVVQAWSAL